MILRQRKTSLIKSIIGFCFILLSILALTIQWMNMSSDTGSVQKSNKVDLFAEVSCSIKCPRASPNKPEFSSSSSESCPEYFRWIHEDLRPWKETGITREMVERARKVAHIRIVIVDGRVYLEKYKPTFQKRDVVTLWGILQLLKFYPGMLPDLDFVFECGDQPVTQRSDYENSKDTVPPPLFHYCGKHSSFDIVFPDWSFWGWPELNMRPWDELKKELQQSNELIKWTERVPYAYWKGNVVLGEARRDLLKCNVSKKQDWNARIYGLQWGLESSQGYKTSALATQCTHRYKIYVEGLAWSVSQKYILACDSMALSINPHFYDFFTRSLLPTVHYWPINEKNKCKSIKFAVDWGNKNAKKAQEIGKAGSKFVYEELEMKYIYDYMFHLLSEYAKLLKYRPTVPRDAVEVCSDTLICSAKGIRKKYRVHSMVHNVSSSKTCAMPSWSPADLQDFIERKENLTKQVELWEETQSF
ncbi:O-glucosyltransferase rumi [Capsicum chacoense]